LQNTRFELAECATIARVARRFVDDAVARHLCGELDVPTAAMVTYRTTDHQTAVVGRCVQLHGGYGYMSEYPIARRFVDGRVSCIYAGANEVMKELISRALCPTGERTVRSEREQGRAAEFGVWYIRPTDRSGDRWTLRRH
jgi:acyl-CoA dehydrogenase